jgi:hypothetical protein
VKHIRFIDTVLYTVSSNHEEFKISLSLGAVHCHPLTTATTITLTTHDELTTDRQLIRSQTRRRDLSFDGSEKTPLARPYADRGSTDRSTARLAIIMCPDGPWTQGTGPELHPAHLTRVTTDSSGEPGTRSTCSLQIRHCRDHN